MDKKAFPNLEADFKPLQPGFLSKASGFSNHAFGIIKLILGICLLPFVYSATLAFLEQFARIEKSLQLCFWSGVISELIIYLFIWEQAIIYARGQKILEMIFNFFKPLVRVAPYLLPVYTLIILVLYGIFSLVIKSSWLIEYFLFLSGFTACLHLIFSAKSIRSKKSDFLKANYIFGFSFVYIINIAILALCLKLIFKDFSFLAFCNSAFSAAKDIFYAVFKQLFLRGIH